MTVADLTPIALAQLEAKLMADLDVVRKVRALLEEHRIPVMGVGAPAVTAGVGGMVVAAQAATPHIAQPPRRPYEEIFTDCLRAMPAEGFNLGALKQALRKEKVNPSDNGVKTDMNRLIRQGKVVVVKSAIGRIGSTYRYVVPVEASTEKEAHPPTAGATDAVSGADSGENRTP